MKEERTDQTVDYYSKWKQIKIFGKLSVCPDYKECKVRLGDARMWSNTLKGNQDTNFKTMKNDPEGNSGNIINVEQMNE